MTPVEALPLDSCEIAPGLSKAAWEAVARYVGREGVAIEQETLPVRCTGGLANRNYLLSLRDGKRAVLRMPPTGVLPPGANDMAREHRILSRLWRALPLAPRSFLHCDDEKVAGTSFHLLEFRDGVAIRGDAVTPFPKTASTGAALSKVVVEALVSVHAVEPQSVGLQDLGRPEGFLARTTNSWVKRAELVCGAEMPSDLRKVTEWLANGRTEAKSVDRTLLHNDFKLDHLLLGSVTMHPRAILDWDMGTRGDALFDLATLLSYWTEPGDPECMHRLAQMPTAGAGFLSREHAAQQYADLTGRGLDAFLAYRVLAMFKLSVVFMQLHARWRRGEVVDPRYQYFDGLARELAGFTLTVAHGKTF